VPGVWVAGNAADVTAQVMTAAAQGMGAATATNVDLVFEAVRAAVEQARADPREASYLFPGSREEVGPRGRQPQGTGGRPRI
jgi:hypothetical protein